MNSAPAECLRCRGKMEVGVVLDRGHYSALAEPQWMEGPVERSAWTGIKTKNRDMYNVTTYRCERCGYLESYANTHVEK